MALSQFHPASRAWFTAQFGEATEVQAQAWPAIKSGRHTLISAPTGSGKTLAAFYAAIDALLVRGLQRQLHPGVQILYVSPLKALSNDIHKNLEIPLKGIAENLRSSHQTAVDISIAVRTGDTPASARQKMAKNPPHILVTTPESLYLLLSSASGRAMLANVATVIVDEIHAMLGDKRGSHLALSIERLQNLVLKNSGQGLQRIGLSATQRPIEMVAKYLVGNNNCQQGIVDCEIIDAGFRRRMDIRLEVPGSPLSALMSNEVWEELYQRLVELISSHQTTLVFVNTRRLSERLALALAERLGNEAVCSHHGSMSKDLRHDAEQRLKAGKLKVLVATASMELGIDIGSVDLVVQFSSPKSIATFLQRIGRSGHSIHGTPKGILFPLTRDDLVESTALLHCIKQGELDCIVMPEMPLDILSQQIVAEVSSQAHDRIGQSGELFDQQESGWDVEELFNLFRNAYSYRNLQRKQFDSIVKMLADGYTSRRGRRGTHLHFDAINKRIRARRGANLIALTNGGAIPDMFDYQVVLDPEDIVVGSLNEDFALEALPGDIFTLGTHSWQLLRVDGLKVRVRDAQGMQATIPFWFGEGIGRTRELSDAVSTLRQTIADLLVNDSANAAVQWLLELAGLPHSAATQIVEYLETGMNALGLMPTRSTIVMERFFDEVGDMHVVIHSPFGSRINRGWGLALRKRFCKSFNFELQAAANEDSIVISLGTIHSFPLDDVFKYLQSATVKDVLVQALLDAPMFEVRWRWNATRALAIQRNRNGKRVPPQFQRMDAEDLVAHVFPDQLACAENISGRREVPDHPLVNQTIHDCLTEAMDIEQLTELITDIEQDKLTLVAKDLREPSPFAQEIINARPYAFLDDAPFEERRTNAIRNRSWTDPGEAKDFSLLDEEAIARVRDEAWPFINNVEEFHDGLLSLGYMTEQEFESNQYQRWQQVLLDAGRILKLTTAPKLIWIATEKLACFSALFPQLQLPKNVPDFILQTKWEREDALREIVRCRLECLGPTRPQQLATELGLRLADIDMALLALEVEGYAFQGQFTPSARTQLTDTATRIEWCERRLLPSVGSD
jgi:ATP-dependent helicase Lhr and Lhr-like helicase